MLQTTAPYARQFVGNPSAAAALAALHARSVALNAKYGLPKERPDLPPGVTPPGATPPPPGGGSGGGTPPLTLEQQAMQQAMDALNPQLAAIRQQQALADTQAAARAQAIAGFSKAAAAALGALPAQDAAAYQGAAGEVGDLAKGMSSGIGDRLAADEGANVDFAQSQGAPVQNGDIGENPGGVQDSTYLLGGYIPGASLAEQGAAAETYANALPAVEFETGRGQLAQANADANQTDQQYADQLVQVANTFPQLRDQALQALQTLELNKMNETLQKQSFGEQVRTDNASIASQKRQDATQARAEAANEEALGLKGQAQTWQQAYQQAELDLKAQSLRLATTKAQQAAQNAIKQGKRIDASASRAAGYLVDRNGNIILDGKGKRIPVAKTTSTSKGPSAGNNAYQKGVSAALQLKNEAKPVPNPYAGVPGTGAYVADPSQPYGVKGGVFPPQGNIPATTNDPDRAQTKGGMTFVQVQGYLMNKYGLTRAQARKAAISAGWKPDGKRP